MIFALGRVLRIVPTSCFRPLQVRSSKFVWELKSLHPAFIGRLRSCPRTVPYDGAMVDTARPTVAIVRLSWQRMKAYIVTAVPMETHASPCTGLGLRSLHHKVRPHDFLQGPGYHLLGRHGTFRRDRLSPS